MQEQPLPLAQLINENKENWIGITSKTKGDTFL